MFAVERLGSYITRGVYTVSGPFHPFGGAVDIIVVQQQDGSFKSSPWYVRFGKFQGVLKTKEKVVNICVNGLEAGFHMYLDNKGEAYFLKDSESEEGECIISPLSSGDETDEKTKNGRLKKIQSLNFDGSQKEPGAQVGKGNGKIMARTTSKHPRILGLVFGRRSMKEDENSRDVQRVSSLERAEIAADLLEVKWSTNLSTHTLQSETSLGKPSESDYPDVVDNEKSSPEMHSPVKDFSPAGSINSHGEIIGDNFETSISCQEQSQEIDSRGPTYHTDEKVLEVNASENGDASTDSNKLMTSEEVVLESITNGQNPDILDASVTSVGSASDRSTGDPATSVESRETNEIVSHSQCLRMHEVVEFYSLDAGDIDNKDKVVSHEMVVETDVAIGGLVVESKVTEATSVYCEPLQSTNIRDDVSADHKISAVNVSPDSGERSECHDELMCQTNMLISGGILPESDISINEEDSDKKYDYNMEVSKLEDSSKGMTKLGSIYSITSESNYHSQEMDACGKKLKVDSSNLPNAVDTNQEFDPSSTPADALEGTVLTPESFEEEEQFLFSDIDSFVAKQTSVELVPGGVTGDIEDCSVNNLEDNVEFKDLKSAQSHEQLSEMPRTQTSPINIPRTRPNIEETDLLTRSLPNFHSHIHDLEEYNLCHPISCSLDIDSEGHNIFTVKKEKVSSSKLEAGSGINKTSGVCGASTPADVAADDSSRNQKEHKAIPNSPAVELSLSKHLLYEGMGADAANEAFNSEKVNVESFSALGPSILKNDKLVIRIRGQYFPWDAAAPIILGIISFGQEHILKHQGMIAVDQTEKNIKVDTTGGSWRLWPFSFKKSKSIQTVQLAPESTMPVDADTNEGSTDLSGDNGIEKLKVMKKKVRSLTPSSEELASLNLKEGQNVVTFCFSTAMLGQQQVDARIYLWKWNTHIVVSDVDGTITRSDVLGQFMPLVGIDWSQTGVAHLFSAIKENGYQLLFLSARAISQAYLTRQFLFNLKQDGKALPDGPVVISPDGLFPSLYREVIRRAPHEFKISCLEVIKALFPPDCNPFYAGFGNRDTDEISYLKVGIPKGKIFIINPKGEVAVNRRVDTRSYTSLHELVNGMFPAMSSSEQEDYNSWNFWKLPLPDIDL